MYPTCTKRQTNTHRERERERGRERERTNVIKKFKSLINFY